jgi:hypothetical protein
LPIRELRTTLRSVALPFSSSGDRPRRWDFNPLDITPLRGVFFRCPVCLSFFLSLQGTRRVKQRSFNLHLLVKPNEPISGIRLSSVISHNRRRNYLIYTSVGFDFQHLFYFSSQSVARWRFHLLFSAAYLSGILLSDWCYHTVRLYSIQIRTPSLGQVFPST